MVGVLGRWRESWDHALAVYFRRLYGGGMTPWRCTPDIINAVLVPFTPAYDAGAQRTLRLRKHTDLPG